MRTIVVSGILVFCFTASAAPEPKIPPSNDDSALIAEKLLDRVDIDERMEKVPLKEVLEYLQKRVGITLLLDKRALMAGGDVPDPEAFDNKPITLPPLKKVRVETAMRLITDQIDADFYIAPDHVKITTTAAKDLITGQAKRLPELYPDRPGVDDSPDAERRDVVRSTPYVTVSFKETPLVEALKEMASRAGRNVVVSEGAGDKAKTAITVSLSNVAFETAAASLAEAAGLRAMRTGNVVVIVSAERAKHIEEKTAKMTTGFPLLQAPVEPSALETKVKELEDKIKELEKTKK
jgi:hypothetical protein